MNRNLLFFSLLISLSFCSSSWAKAQDRKQAIEISADHKVFDYKKNLGRYRGNVILQQGSLELKADELEITLNGQQVESISLEGKPASFQQQDDDNQWIKGQAYHIEYHFSSGHILLQGKARLEHAGDSLSSERIQYWDQQQRIEAGEENGQSRVHLTIQPPSTESAPK